MPVYAYLLDDNVVALALCESAAVAQQQIIALGLDGAIDVTHMSPRPQRGWIMAPGEAPTPGPAPAARSPRHLATRHFLDRFTESEWEQLSTHPSAPARAFCARLQACGNVWLDDPRLSAALAKMVTAGILSPERPAQILE